MTKPIFSFIAPAIRSGFYKRFYDSVHYKNKIPFEVIFVGNEKPSIKMPSNFHYIYSNVKPAQCLEIAARNAQGDYLIPSGDDIVLSNRFLNKLNTYIEQKSEDVFIGFRLAVNGIMRDDWLHWTKIDYPLALSGVFKRNIWIESGGIDQGFIFAFADTDMQLRFREVRELFITHDCWMDEVRDAHKVKRRASRIVPLNGEKNFCNQFWVENDQISKVRLKLVVPFDDKDILTKTQGRNVSGMWD